MGHYDVGATRRLKKGSMDDYDIGATIKLENIWKEQTLDAKYFYYGDICARVKKLLEKGADPDAVESRYMLTGLHLACVHGRKDLWDLLMYYGADVTKSDMWGNTVLHLAASYMSTDVGGFFSTVLGLFETDVDLPNDAGSTPLHSLCTLNENPNEILTLLLNRGASPDRHRGSVGFTPLHIAAEKNRSVIVSRFIHEGANLEIKNDDGKTALEIAIDRESSDACRHLIYAGAGVKTSDSRIGLLTLGLCSRNAAVRNVFYVWLKEHERGKTYLKSVLKEGIISYVDGGDVFYHLR